MSATATIGSGSSTSTRPMLGWDGKPRAELFLKDGLHMSPKGYAIWNVLVAPFLE